MIVMIDEESCYTDTGLIINKENFVGQPYRKWILPIDQIDFYASDDSGQRPLFPGAETKDVYKVSLSVNVSLTPQALKFYKDHSEELYQHLIEQEAVRLVIESTNEEPDEDWSEGFD